MGDISYDDTYEQLGTTQSAQAETYKPLVEEARRTLRRIMMNSNDPKLAAQVAQDILDRGGDIKKGVSAVGSQNVTIIKDSQVQLLMSVHKELLEQ